MTDEMTLTYQTRLWLDEEKEEIFQAFACLFNTVERSLYAEVSKGNSSASCKNSFLKKYGITARQFNAAHVSLRGKLSASRSAQERSLFSLGQQIKSLDSQIQKLEKKPSKAFSLHQKKRKRDILARRVSAIEEDIEKTRTRLCFGGKKLFLAQYHLEKNGFSSHQEWKEVWESKRNSEFFVLGSKDETAGNQTCTASLQENGKLVLRLRLPKALEKMYGKYLEVENVEFAYGQKAIVEALNNKEGQAISYRFKKDNKSWKVFASTAMKKPSLVSHNGQGVIGIDLNTDHIALSETDRFGNLIRKESLSWICYGKTKNQLKAKTADLCKYIVNKAKEAKKPLIIEKLDFQKKKLALQEESMARLLSSFAYGQFFSNLQVRSFKHGVEVHTINPAYTSIIGSINYAKRYGISSHLAAAFCIARRYQQFSELPHSSCGIIPDRKGGHVAFVLPVRNRTKHVWHFWGQVKKKTSTVLAAHKPAISNRSFKSAFKADS